MVMIGGWEVGKFGRLEVGRFGGGVYGYRVAEVDLACQAEAGERRLVETGILVEGRPIFLKYPEPTLCKSDSDDVRKHELLRLFLFDLNHYLLGELD